MIKASFRRTGRASSRKNTHDEPAASGKLSDPELACPLHGLQSANMVTYRCALSPAVDPDDLDALWCQPKSAAALHHTSSTPASQRDPSHAASRDGEGLGKLRVERPSSTASADRPGSPASGASEAEGSAAERTASGSSAGALFKFVPSLPCHLLSQLCRPDRCVA
jgi:hypothetical protein